jgi:hypothetical protein
VAAGSVAPATQGAGIVAKATAPAAEGIAQPAPDVGAAVKATPPAPVPDTRTATLTPAAPDDAVAPKAAPLAPGTADIVKVPPPSALENVAPPVTAAVPAVRAPRASTRPSRQYRSADEATASAWKKPRATVQADRGGDADRPGTSNSVAAAMTDELVRESARVKPAAQPSK